jgi:3-oxoacyl-[acyl-carrier protein] reductase
MDTRHEGHQLRAPGVCGQEAKSRVRAFVPYHTGQPRMETGYPLAMNLGGAVAIVTGGGTGIGRAVSESLARAGAAAVVVNYSRSGDDADATSARLEELGCEGVPYRASVAVDSDVKRMIDDTVARFGRLDVLVNNAGITHFIAHGDLDALTDEVWDEIIAVNLKGTFYASRAAARALRETHGAIVNVASIAGTRAAGSSIPYGVSKAGVLQLTRNLALALAPEVRVNAVAPGMVDTRWHRNALGPETATAIAEQIRTTTPMHDVATPEHVAQAVMAFLATDLVTGEFVVVDGGKHLAY